MMIQLIINLRACVNKGTSIEVYIEDDSAYHGFKLVQIGTKKASIDLFTMPAQIDRDLIFNKLIPSRL